MRVMIVMRFIWIMCFLICSERLWCSVFLMSRIKICLLLRMGSGSMLKMYRFRFKSVMKKMRFLKLCCVVLLLYVVIWIGLFSVFFVEM